MGSAARIDVEGRPRRRQRVDHALERTPREAPVALGREHTRPGVEELQHVRARLDLRPQGLGRDVGHAIEHRVTPLRVAMAHGSERP